MEITVKGLGRSYGGVPVFRNVSFTAKSGAVTCLSAPSGWGKTTLLRILLGLERADAGTVEGLRGLRCAAVFQEDRLLEGLTPEENLRFVQGRDYDGAATAALLRELGLVPGEEKPVRDFSGGMRRRVALARALSIPFDVLFLDEPYSGLDAENRRAATDVILRRSGGKTIFLVTHERQDAAAFGAEIVDLTKMGV